MGGSRLGDIYVLPLPLPGLLYRVWNPILMPGNQFIHLGGGSESATSRRRGMPTGQG